MAGTGTADRVRRAYGPTLVVGLASAGAVALSVARPWVRGEAAVPGVTAVEAGLDGASLAPLAGALGLVLLAGFGAVIATRGIVRRVVGAIIVVAAVVVLAGTLWLPGDIGRQLADALSAKGWTGSGDVSRHSTLWRWLGTVGALGCAVAGSFVAWWGSRFPAMGSRYDVPAAEPAVGSGAATGADGDLDVWRAIDRGDDPTV